MRPSTVSLAFVFAFALVLPPFVAGATSSLALSLAGAARCAVVRSRSAAPGANLAASAATPVSGCP
jgi:hypothetical protein